MNRRLVALTITAVAVCAFGATPPTTAAPSTPVSPAAARTEAVRTQVPDRLAIGARGAQVTELQERFAGWGYTITVDGWFGPQTDGVVRSWQRSNGLTVDGIVGPVTAASLDMVAETTGPEVTRGPFVTDPPQSVEDMIRQVWPDELEQRALTIAYRESRYVPTARNYCCHGIFQIYFTVHSGWLDDFGVTTVEQLYDPMTNVRMGYELYKRAGWGPWSQTDPGA